MEGARRACLSSPLSEFTMNNRKEIVCQLIFVWELKWHKIYFKFCKKLALDMAKDKDKQKCILFSCWYGMHDYVKLFVWNLKSSKRTIDKKEICTRNERKKWGSERKADNEAVVASYYHCCVTAGAGVPLLTRKLWWSASCGHLVLDEWLTRVASKPDVFLNASTSHSRSYVCTVCTVVVLCSDSHLSLKYVKYL